MTSHPDRSSWAQGARRSAARDRILAIAGDVFAQHGADASMSEIAAAVGCSRATLYRHFDSRTALQLAYVEQIAFTIGAAVTNRTAHLTAPDDRLTEAILFALTEVRADPALSAWFSPAGAGLASELALSSSAIETLANRFVGDHGAAGVAAARWIVRVIVSLLVVPAGPDERETIERFVTPAVLASFA
ncbi:TetR/AcrR family transcriptional regulator [Gordonia sp. HY285]|uniref:TetR/AcrR family transcriptional regulator n=1 Tax=Gordonia liuliyuniae TaxID=2911517 RepID=UPI001F30FFAD|nr:TetR/AcrR family transcriptional regulator [Gordonia liuliyuniae]MCF8609448.1 TetR/AcrR family transcriptional regulator [Gordonia liuliyuniae]